MRLTLGEIALLSSLVMDHKHSLSNEAAKPRNAHISHEFTQRAIECKVLYDKLDAIEQQATRIEIEVDSSPLEGMVIS
jgi:hypothetical protein